MVKQKFKEKVKEEALWIISSALLNLLAIIFFSIGLTLILNHSEYVGGIVGCIIGYEIFRYAIKRAFIRMWNQKYVE